MSDLLGVLWLALGCAWLVTGAQELLDADPGDYVGGRQARCLLRSFACIVLAVGHAAVAAGYAYGWEA